MDIYNILLVGFLGLVVLLFVLKLINTSHINKCCGGNDNNKDCCCETFIGYNLPTKKLTSVKFPTDSGTASKLIEKHSEKRNNKKPIIKLEKTPIGFPIKTALVSRKQPTKKSKPSPPSPKKKPKAKPSKNKK